MGTVYLDVDWYVPGTIDNKLQLMCSSGKFDKVTGTNLLYMPSLLVNRAGKQATPLSGKWRYKGAQNWRFFPVMD